MLKRFLSVILFLLVGSFTIAQDYRLMLQSGGKPTAKCLNKIKRTFMFL